MKDNYLIASGEWSDGLHCPTLAGDLGAVPLGSIPFGRGFNLLAFFLFLGISFIFLVENIFLAI